MPLKSLSSKCALSFLAVPALVASLATPAAGQAAAGTDAAAAPAQAPDTAKSGPASVLGNFELGGLVDGYYDYYSTKPEGDATFRNFDTRHNAVRFSMGQIWLTKTPTGDSRAGMNVKFNFGHAATMINAAEPSTVTALKYIEQAYASALLPVGKGLQIDAGKYVTHNGAEVIEAKDNWNYSRGLLFALAIPYYHTGVRATYSFNDKVS